MKRTPTPRVKEIGNKNATKKSLKKEEKIKAHTTSYGYSNKNCRVCNRTPKNKTLFPNFLNKPAQKHHSHNNNKPQHRQVKCSHYTSPSISCSRSCPQAAEISNPLDSRIVQCKPRFVK